MAWNSKSGSLNSSSISDDEYCLPFLMTNIGACSILFFRKAAIRLQLTNSHF